MERTLPSGHPENWPFSDVIDKERSMVGRPGPGAFQDPGQSRVTSRRLSRGRPLAFEPDAPIFSDPPVDKAVDRDRREMNRLSFRHT
jgi:hypothetical protein